MTPLTEATAGLLRPLKLHPDDRLEVKVDRGLKHFNVRIYAADSNGHRNYPSVAARQQWLERVPEKRALEYKDEWQLAATDYTAEIISAVWPPGQVTMEGGARQVMEYLLLTSKQQEDNVRVTAEFKETGAVPEHDLEMHPDLPLEPYQQVALYCSMRSEAYNLFMQQGTGKTPVVVARVCNEAKQLHESGEQRMLRVLVVCPKNVRRNWEREFTRFSTQPGKVTSVRGGFVRRTGTIIEALRDEEGCRFTACVMSYEAMCRSWEVLECIDWDLVVLDEGHYIKSVRTARTGYAMKLRGVARRRMVLTGTPISNSPLDLYSLFEFDGEGWSGFRDWKAFREFYGVFAGDGETDGYQKLVGVQNRPFMKERLARTSFVITKAEALPWLPEKMYDVLEHGLSKRQAEVYQKIADELLVKIEDEMDSSNNRALTVTNILTQLLRLAQVCAGYVVWDEVLDPQTLEVLRPGTVEFFDENPKLDALVEALKEKGPDEKTIVWSCFVPCIQQQMRRLDQEGVRYVTYYGGTKEQERLEAEDAFNCDPEVRVLLGNPAAGGVGLNLLGYPPHAGEGHTTNCDHHLYYACDWSYVKRSQSEDRSHRRGTRVPVRITDLVAPETIDEEIRAHVLKKKLMAMDFEDIRDILGAIRHGIVTNGEDE